MVFKARLAIFAIGFAALAIFVPATTQAGGLVDVTFTVPVQIQNIHSDWGKVGVFCSGGGPESSIRITPDSNLQIGIIDVSNKARGSIDETVTGTIQLPDTNTQWACELKVQYTGESTFRLNLGTEVKISSVVSQSGQF